METKRRRGARRPAELETYITDIVYIVAFMKTISLHSPQFVARAAFMAYMDP